MTSERAKGGGASRADGLAAGMALLAAVGLALVCGAAEVALISPHPARAQGTALFPKPWRPSRGDTIGAWASEARALLHGSKGVELGPGELQAYGLIDRITRAYLNELGPRRMSAAVGISAALDSLQIKAQISQDPHFPAFLFVQYLNPDFENYASLAYLYWFRGAEVRSQPVNLRGGRDPSLSVYWTGEEQAPYEAGVLFYEGFGRKREPMLYLFRLTPTGAAWLPAQTGDDDIDLGRRGTAAWADLDRDGKPELISWTEGLPDSFFIPCEQLGCPEILTERIFVRTPSGFRLYDQRSVASPYATLVLFVRALARREESFAQTLTSRPTVMAKVRELGWVGLARGGAFRAVAPEEQGRWPDRLRFEFGSAGKYTSLLEVRFVNTQGHWLIDEVVVLRQAEEKPRAGAGEGASGSRPAPGQRSSSAPPERDRR